MFNEGSSFSFGNTSRSFFLDSGFYFSPEKNTHANGIILSGYPGFLEGLDSAAPVVKKMTEG